MQKTLPNGKWRKRLKIKALPPFAELHKVRAGTCKIFARNIYRSVSEPTIHWEGYEYDEPNSKPSSPSKMQEIERELDEIEATLDVISEAENSDGKITPIWNSKPPKR